MDCAALQAVSRVNPQLIVSPLFSWAKKFYGDRIVSHPRYLKALAILVALIVPLTVAGDSSEFLVTNWRTEDGLPHSSVNSLVQAKDGYLWIGTYVGVARFDGTRFVHFSTASLPQLGPGRVSRLFEDRDGVLWIGLESGRLLAFRDGETRIHLPNSEPANQAIIAMAQDQMGTIWIQTSSGNLGKLTSDSVEFVATTGPFYHRASLDLVVDKAGALWVGTKDGLRIREKDRLVIPPGMTGLPNQPHDAFAAARDGGLWTVQSSRLKKIRDGQMILDEAVPTGLTNPAEQLLETLDGRLWLAAGDGGLFYRKSSGEWQAVAREPGLQGSHRTLCEDREGNLWRGGFGTGLTRLRPRMFTTHELPATDQDRYAMAVSADADGNIWALFNGQTLGRIAADTGAMRFWKPPELPLSFRTLFHDRAHSLWLGTGSGLIYRMRGGRFSLELQLPSSDYASAFFKDSKSNLWIGFTGGAGVGFMPQSDPKQWRVVEGLSFPDVRCIAEAADGAMWFGTHYGGAFRWHNEKWTRYTGRDGLPSDYVRSLLADADGTVWLATINGLCRWREGKISAITTAQGLWHNSLSHITDDGRGNLWFSSFGGVFRVARQQLHDFAEGRRDSIQCIGYGRNDGLPALESPGGFQPAGARTPDGRLWFPTVNGFVSIAPDAIRENTMAPPVWIEEVIADGDSQRIQHSAPTLVIGPGKRRLDFRFTALSVSAPEKIRFRHKLEGLEEEWSAADAEHIVTYSHIPPGDYTFRVTACNNDGVWNPDGHSLRVEIQPFFWQTRWFQGGMGLLLIAGVALTVRRVERWKAQLRLERLEQQHAIEHERSRIAKDIHDDLGANLTQIVFLSQRAEASHGDLKEAAHWLRLIPATARRTIQSLDEIVWAINPKHDSLESLANYLSQFASEHFNLAGIRCVLDVPMVLPALQLSAELRHHIVLAAREAIQNVVAHAAATEARVSLQLDNEQLRIIIADNGRGFDILSVSPEGNGLHNMRQRMEEIGGKTEIESQPEQGTTIRLSVSRRLIDRTREKSRS
ncbi:MAG TPA: two-component regulator propeller domain-containing protein [Verrucomicrobiae bacterium]|nr:two-component regulator propeller domain-containing protein [Verrucomicrobiae bacterium]